MIDNFALALTHGLMILAAWRLWHSDTLDREDAAVDPPRRGRWGRRPDA